MIARAHDACDYSSIPWFDLYTTKVHCIWLSPIEFPAFSDPQGESLSHPLAGPLRLFLLPDTPTA
jgi:hypothetical protein